MMSQSSTISRSLVSAAALAFVLSLAAEPGFAQQSPFGGLAGSWAGNGTIRLADGRTERIRCRAGYQVNDGGRNLVQNLRCASDSYNFDLRSNVNYNAGAISGTWAEVSRNASGRLSGTAQGGLIQAAVQGPGFAAGLALQSRGNTQNVTIRSQGTELSEVSITMSRAR